MPFPFFGRKLDKPDYLSWSFGGKKNVSCAQAGSSEFQLQLKPEAKSFSSFREEVFAACKKIDQARNGKKIALCYNAGISSELIAQALHELGIPFEPYFLDLWGLNRQSFDEWSASFLKKINKEATIISLKRSFFYEEYAYKIFRKFACEYPTYIALTYLFEQIPSQQYIVVGDGGLDRRGELYSEIAKKYRSPPAGFALPFATSSVFYHLWAKWRKREGEFYFFRSTEGLLRAVSNHPSFSWNFPFSDTRSVIYQSFPEISERPRSTNWDGAAYQENIWIRFWLRSNLKKKGELGFWESSTGTIVDLSSLLKA